MSATFRGLIIPENDGSYNYLQLCGKDEGKGFSGILTVYNSDTFLSVLMV